MSFFSDLFGGGYQDAAQAQINALNTAYKTATPFYDTARGNITDYGAAALSPYTSLFSSATPGIQQYGAAVGLTGNPADVQARLAATPGYQFAQDEALRAVDRGAASRGLATSGNLISDEMARASGLASQNYNNYVNQLLPYLNLGTTAAAGISGANQWTGGNLASTNLNQGNLGYNTQVGIGNAQAAADTAAQNAQNSFLSGALGLGSKLLGYGLGGGGSQLAGQIFGGARA